MEEDTIKVIAQAVGGVLSVAGDTLKNLGKALDDDSISGCSPIPIPSPLVGGIGNTLKFLGAVFGQGGFDL